MSLLRKITGNTLIRVAARLVGNVVGIIVVGLLTRYLGEEGFGNYTTILAYLFFFGALADLGLYMITINEINSDSVDKSRFYSAIYSLRVCTGILLMLGAIALVWLFPYPLVVKQGVLIVAISIFLGLMDQIQVALYQAELRVLRVAVAELLGKVVLLAGVFWGISMQVSLLPLLWAVVAGQAIQWLITLTGVKSFVTLRVNFDPEYWKKIVVKTWPIALSQLFVLIYFKMDTVLLSLLRPQEIAQIEVGLYGAPYKILEVLIALVPIFMGLVSPVLAQAWSRGDTYRFRHMYQTTFDAFSIVTWPMVLGGIMLAQPIMQLLAPGFSDSGRILQILMIATGVIFFAHLPTYAVVTLGQQRIMLKTYALAAFFALLLYVIFIPIYSFWAAAWVTVLVESIVLVLAWQRIFTVTRQKMKWGVFTKALLSALGMVAVIAALPDFNVFVLIAVGAVCYVTALILTKAVTGERIKTILSNKKSVS